MAVDPRHSNRNDAAILWSMTSWLSGAGAAGGGIGIARASRLAGADLAMAVLFAVLTGAAVLWIVWGFGLWLLPKLASRGAIPREAPWSRVLPPMYALLFAGLVVGGVIGGALTHLLIRFALL